MFDAEVYLVAKYKVEGVNNYATIQECVDFLKLYNIHGLDIETTKKYKKGLYDESVYQGGLDPYLSKVVMIQIGNLERVFVIDVRDFTKEELQPLIDFLSWNDNVLFVGHNLKFEGRHLSYNYGIRLKKVHDTMVTELILTNGLSFKYGLINLSERYLGIEGPKENKLFEDSVDFKRVTLNDKMLEENEHLFTPFEVESDFYIDKSTRLQFLNIGKKPFTLKQVMYGSDDILLPLLIRERQIVGRKISGTEIYKPTKLIHIENTFTQVLADVENNGMSFNKEAWLVVAEKNEGIYAERVGKLNKYVTTIYPYTAQGNLFNPDADCAIEWSSSKQVISLFRRIGFCPKEWSKQTESMEWTVGAVSLLKLIGNQFKEAYFKDKWIEFEKDEDGKFIVSNDHLILAYLLVKKTEQAITTFGRDWLKYVHPITGRIHPNFRQILNTGRLSSVKPNLLNIKGGEYRSCFKVGAGKKMVNTDYSAQEIRILADKSNDPLFVSFFTQGDEFYGEDFHAYTASKVFSIMRGDPDFIVPPKGHPDFTEEHATMRDKAKTVNFGIAYGKSAIGFSQDFGMVIEDAEKLINSYLEVYEGLAQYFLAQRALAENCSYIRIDDYTDRRWFNPQFPEMKNLNAEIWEFYPEDYRMLSKTEREAIKAELYEENPQIKTMWSQYFRMRGSYERKFLNYPIQGSASSILKIAMCGLRNELIEKKLDDFMLTNFIHDEVLAEVPEDKGDEYGALLSKWMVKGGEYLCHNVPMVAEYVLSDVWGH